MATHFGACKPTRKAALIFEPRACAGLALEVADHGRACPLMGAAKFTHDQIEQVADDPTAPPMKRVAARAILDAFKAGEVGRHARTLLLDRCEGRVPIKAEFVGELGVSRVELHDGPAVLRDGPAALQRVEVDLLPEEAEG